MPKLTIEQKKLEEVQMLRIVEARGEIFYRYPHLYRIMNRVEMETDFEVPTLCVYLNFNRWTKKWNGTWTMAWNPAFIAKANDDQVIGLIMHELMHLILKHTTGRRPDYASIKTDSMGRQVISKEDMEKSQLWNMATDLAINQYLVNYLKLPNGQKGEIGGIFPDDPEIQMPLNQTAEQYYKLATQQNDQAKQKFLEMLKKLKEKIGDHSGWTPLDEKNKPQGPVINVKMKGGSGDPSDEDGEGEGSDIDKEIEKTLGEIAEAAEKTGLCKLAQAGTSKVASSEITLDHGGAKKVPGWMNKTTQTSVHGFDILNLNTRKVPNRRFGVLFPGKRRQQVGNKVLVAVDVSGSIDMPLYNEFCAHLNNMLKFAEFDMVTFNTELLTASGMNVPPQSYRNALRRYRRGDKVAISGGTDFEPVIQMWNLAHRNYDAIFIFTDGCASYQTAPVDPKYVNWIIYNSPNMVDCVKHGNRYIMERTQAGEVTYGKKDSAQAAHGEKGATK